MSLYNLINGVKPACFFLLPMLGKHPDEYPRFRDCFIGDDERPEHANKIIVYTRTGGGNRDAYQAENDALRAMPGFVTDYDDSFDCTFACWVFDVPDKWKGDFDAIMSGDLAQVSDAYLAEMKRVYPKLIDKLGATFRPAVSA